MDWEILLKYLPMYEKAAWLTIQIGFMGVAGATVLGLICAVIQYERIPFLKANNSDVHRTQQKYTTSCAIVFYLLWTAVRLGFRRIRRSAEL